MNYPIYPDPEEIRDASHQWFVFEQEGKVIGCAVAKKNKGEVGHLALEPTYRGKGAGSQLVLKSVSFLRDLDFKGIWALSKNY